MRRVVLLDRDGTINAERHYLRCPEEVELLPGAAEGIRSLRGLGLPVVVVTNQSAVGRGLLDLAGLARIHDRLRELLAREGAVVDAIYFCPHLPEAGCECRKPRTGLARQAAEAFGADCSASFVIGDKPCDIQLGTGVGATTILVRTGYGEHFAGQDGLGADFIVQDLREAASTVESLLKTTRTSLGTQASTASAEQQSSPGRHPI